MERTVTSQLVCIAILVLVFVGLCSMAVSLTL
jgi:hypothetical protein